jgi:hypothetical protein
MTATAYRRIRGLPSQRHGELICDNTDGWAGHL